MRFPVLTRQELRDQVASEGSLLKPADRIAVKSHSSSGSSGVPVSFYISEYNGRYNAARSIAQHFIQGQDLSINRTRIRNANAPIANGFSVQNTETWLGPLASLFKSGINKHIDYFTLSTDDCRRLIEELKKDAIGYLVCSPRLMDTILSSFDLQFLKDAETEIWIPLGENIDPHLVEIFENLAIPIRANYSCEEVGMIGLECDRVAGCYHVATSNVIVEVVDLVHDLDGIRRGRILITHLHSYATPFIRYDVGDLGRLAERCPCGHDGPTLSHLHGRLSSVIKHRDGHLSPFYIRGKDLVELAKFDEFRVRQIAFDKS